MSSENKAKDDFKRSGKCACQDEYIRKWLNNASIDGLDHIVEGKSTIRRIIWIAILVASAIVCLYGIIDNCITFFGKPTATTVNFESRENGLAFPAVTVCNLNPVLRSYAVENNITEFLEAFLDPRIQQLIHDREMSDTDCNRAVELFGVSNSTLTLNNLYVDGGNKLRNFIVECRFNENRTTSENCMDELQPFLTEFGLCYTFNSARNNKPDRFIRSSGRRNSLQMVIEINRNEYLLPSTRETGVLVSVHHRNDFPEPLENGIAVPPGQSAWISLTAHEMNDNTGLDKCENNNKDLEFIPDLDYSISACQRNARRAYVARDDICNCRIEYPEGNASSNQRNCTLADACCIIDSLFINEGPCLPPCYHFTYQSSTSYLKVQLRETLLASLNTNEDFIKDNILSVNVYFQDLYVTTSETVLTYSAISLLSDIGGVVGLFLGASIIAIVEVVILLFDEIKRICCVKKVREKIDEFELKHRLPSFQKKEESENVNQEYIM